MNYVWKIENGKKVRIKDYDPGFSGSHTDRDSADLELQALSNELNELQELLAAAQKNSLLVVLQGMDTSGKDGTIRHVLSHVNPQGCFVHSFKAPTQEELAHDFLWRVHKVTPGKGEMGIFNRSHYEDVLVARVNNLVTENVWSHRYEEINHFEQILAQSGMIILKFFLHISYDEQERRLLAREEDKDKSWKLSAEDWEDRKKWSEYENAYEDALSKCSTGAAPWCIVPGNHKWFRNLAVAHTIVHSMRQYKDEWKAALEERGREELEKLKQLRGQS
ncbi:MAG TPA: PPK2 family polyphosphate kinase [Ktedonobacteraceae bacterium]|nr:PPK2 family polyphosphate kinase [Ktedonobacteraceae bacterium]